VNIRICAPIAAERVSKMIPLIKKAESSGADLIEVRLDYLNSLRGIEKIVETASLPLIATNRQHEQGGRRLQSEDQRVRALIDAANLGFHYVDIELTASALESIVQELKELGAKTIISFHDFKRTPDALEMEKIVRAQTEAGAEICKLVTTANEIADNISCLLLTLKMSEIIKVVCFAMGSKGILSRVLSPIFGAHFTYASIKRGLETAPGQLSIFDLKKLYRSLGVESWTFPETRRFVH